MRSAAKLKSGVAAPAIVGMKRHAMNRGEYFHDVLTNARKYRRKEVGAAEIAALQGNFKTLNDAVAKRDGEMAAAVKQLSEAQTRGETASKEVVDQLKAIGEDSKKLSTRMLELEQKSATITADFQRHNAPRKSVGEYVTEQDNIKKLMTDKGGREVVKLKSITSATTGAGGAGDLVRPDRVPEIIRPQDRPLTIRDLVSVGRTNSNAIEYVQETGFDNQAEMVAETEQKPESSIEFTLKTLAVRTLAHWVIASKQILDDAPMLQSYIDGRLRYGLAFVEENQILAGDGTGQNLLGLIPEASDYNRGAAETKIDVIRKSMTQVRLSEYRADAVILNPIDWEEIELTKTTEGAYVWANPAALLQPTLWGLRVVDTQAIPSGTFLTGAFKLAAQLWDREDANVAISTEDRDNFIKNMVTIRAEERLALAVWRPEALVTGPFAGNVSG